MTAGVVNLVYMHISNSIILRRFRPTDNKSYGSHKEAFMKNQWTISDCIATLRLSLSAKSYKADFVVMVYFIYRMCSHMFLA